MEALVEVPAEQIYSSVTVRDLNYLHKVSGADYPLDGDKLTINGGFPVRYAERNKK